eukprot:2832982-Amphidinium_carterae.1
MQPTLKAGDVPVEGKPHEQHQGTKSATPPCTRKRSRVATTACYNALSLSVYIRSCFSEGLNDAMRCQLQAQATFS